MLDRNQSRSVLRVGKIYSCDSDGRAEVTFMKWFSIRHFYWDLADIKTGLWIRFRLDSSRMYTINQSMRSLQEFSLVCGFVL